MAVRAASATGNLTTAGTWGLVDTTSYNNSESANTALTTSAVASSNFTPGAITIDGFAVKIASRAASPTGTMTLELFNATGSAIVASVTVNVSDVPTATPTSGTTTPVSTAEGGWFFVNTGSITLLAATNYAIRAKTSSSAQVNLWSSATTNWSRYLRTTTTGAPGAGDDMIITGEWTAAATIATRTVTMDSTATTDYGSNTTSQVTPAMSICKGGTLICGVAASTNYNLRLSGYMVVYNGGTCSFGTLGAEIPRTSTATLQFDCVADGDFGRVVRNGGIVNSYGLSRTAGNNTVITKLAANASAGATSLTTVASTGWLNGDSVCYAPTTQTGSQFEKKALTANAVGTALTTTALTNARSGTSPTQAEVGLLTRNVVFTSVTQGTVTFDYIGGTATANLSWTEYNSIGTNATGKLGINVATTTGGTFNMDSCSVHDCDANWAALTSSAFGTISITNTVFYNMGVVNAGSNGGFLTSGAATGTWTVDNCMFCGASTSGFNLVQLNDIGGTFTNNSISGNAGTSSTAGLSLGESLGTLGTFNNLQIHSNTGCGLRMASASYGTLSASDFWRNSVDGIAFLGAANAFGPSFTFLNCNIFGNAGGAEGNSTFAIIFNVCFDSCTFNSDTSFTQAYGIFFNTSAIGPLYLYNTVMSAVAGIKTKQTIDLQWSASGSNNLQGFAQADSCVFNGTTPFSFNVTVTRAFMYLSSQNHNQVANDNRTYYSTGTSTGASAAIAQSDSGTVHGSDPLSQKLSPITTTWKFRSTPVYVPCNSGQTVSFGIYVQKDGSYNGAAPRLILCQQNSMGITADTVCASLSVGSGTWQQLTYTTPVAPQDGVFVFVVDCDGTAGSIYVGDASAS